MILNNITRCSSRSCFVDSCIRKQLYELDIIKGINNKTENFKLKNDNISDYKCKYRK